MRVKVWFFSKIHQNEFFVAGELIGFADDGIRLVSDSGYRVFYEVSDPELLRIEFVR